MRELTFKMLITVVGLGIYIALAMTLENVTGIRFDTTYKVTCAFVCVGFMTKLALGSPGERWPWIAIAAACIFNAGLFLTPVLSHPASRGEIMFFALPDASIFMLTRAITYPETDVHKRAVRQQIFVGLFFAVALSAIILAAGFIPDRPKASTVQRAAPNSPTR